MTATFDSNAWIELFGGSRAAERLKKIVSSPETIYTSAVSLFEIRNFCESNGKPWEEPLGYIRKRSKIVPADEKICLLASEQKKLHKLHALDAIIYATALHTSSTLMTADRDFERIAGVEMIG